MGVAQADVAQDRLRPGKPEGATFGIVSEQM